ncbi:MAG TPA: VWA domain-containing protein, partial [Polyangiaceae bacterium]
AFSSALNSIRSSGVSCEVVIPPPPAGQTLDYQLVNVQYSLLDGSVVELVYDDTCVAANAWHYDNPAAPIYIELCSSSCSTANSSATTELDVEFGCAIRVY